MVATVTVGVVPVSPEPSAVISGTSCWRKSTVRTFWLLPVTVTSSRLSSASSAASTAALFAAALPGVNVIGAVVCPLNVSVKVPPVAFAVVTVWISFVGPSLCGEKPPELPPPAGVSSPVTSQRLFFESKAMSPATWQQAPRFTGTLRIFCSDARSRCGVGVSTSLNRLSWK